MFNSQQGFDVLPWITDGIAAVQSFVLYSLKASGVYYYIVIGVSVAVVLHVIRIGLKWGHLPDSATERFEPTPKTLSSEEIHLRMVQERQERKSPYLGR